jgi:hypothetical protein
MANTITNVVPKLVGLMLPKLRANSIMPRLVNRDFDTLGAQPGSSVDVPLPPTISTVDVTAANTPPSTADITLSTVNVPLSNWKEAPFYMTDKDLLEVEQDKLPGVVESALTSIIDTIDAAILTQASLGAGRGDDQTAGIFAAIGDATEGGKLLNKNKVSRQGRSCVFDADAEAALLGLEAFTSSDYQTAFPIEAGEFGPSPKLGAQWYMDQNVVTHTKGTMSGTVTTNGALVVGDTEVTLAGVSGTIVQGDLLSIDGNVYGVAVGRTGSGGITLNQGLIADVASGSSVTIVDSHQANVMFARDAIVFVSRPFQASNAAIASQTISDPISGLSLRLEVTREHKRDRWSIDALYGTKVVRPEGVVKIAG